MRTVCTTLHCNREIYYNCIVNLRVSSFVTYRLRVPDPFVINPRICSIIESRGFSSCFFFPLFFFLRGLYTYRSNIDLLYTMYTGWLGKMLHTLCRVSSFLFLFYHENDLPRKFTKTMGSVTNKKNLETFHISLVETLIQRMTFLDNKSLADSTRVIEQFFAILSHRFFLHTEVYEFRSLILWSSSL